jgi:hypothetical protein
MRHVWVNTGMTERSIVREVEKASLRQRFNKLPLSDPVFHTGNNMEILGNRLVEVHIYGNEDATETKLVEVCVSFVVLP